MKRVLRPMQDAFHDMYQKIMTSKYTESHLMVVVRHGSTRSRQEGPEIWACRLNKRVWNQTSETREGEEVETGRALYSARRAGIQDQKPHFRRWGAQDRWRADRSQWLGAVNRRGRAAEATDEDRSPGASVQRTYGWDESRERRAHRTFWQRHRFEAENPN